jgi:hypothetical protein
LQEVALDTEGTAKKCFIGPSASSLASCPLFARCFVGASTVACSTFEGTSTAALEPISADRADELARMLALPEARTIRAEQMAYRRKVAAEVEAVEPEQKEQAE